ncbi:MAG TPA: ParB/RepB/Spo0J family partition protein [Candidatus Saccharibacteria bacterium]|nr:ParB/RepB/Spo0J family partition protein [Candidatus Saccharibacteria bacterium]HMT39773.1 ParB/RepB/Spo0J family partition protein [Candidatus Saccharibacteria bacterium]
MSKEVIYKLKDLPRHTVECDQEQPRKNLGSPIALQNLRHSIEQHGIQQPITVTEYEPNRFRIIDGHRRYLCAKELELKMIPCLIYPRLNEGEFEVRRYEMQNIRRPWKPAERSDSLHRMKKKFNTQSFKELAQLIGMSESSVADYLHLRDQQIHLLSRFEQYDLNDSYQIEISRLKPHLRKVANLEAEQIIDNILERIKHEKINSSKEIRIIKSAFIRFDLYDDILAKYFRNFDMRVKELEEQILRTGFSRDIQNAVAAVTKKLAKSERFTPKEKSALRQLMKLSKKALEE